jgi:hypothetical protein
MSALEDLELRIAKLDEQLRPIAQRPVDITRPGWVEQSRNKVPALDEAGVRDEAERVLVELGEIYAIGMDETRAAIRRFFSLHRSFAWAVGWAKSQPGLEGFRQRLILFSVQDQGQDSRDALLAIQAICREAVDAGMDIVPSLREIAALSSTANKYGMGSTRDMLLMQCQTR